MRPHHEGADAVRATTIIGGTGAHGGDHRFDLKGAESSHERTARQRSITP